MSRKVNQPMPATRSALGTALTMILALTLAMAALPGCVKVGPDYTPPQVAMPTGYTAPEAAATDQTPAQAQEGSPASAADQRRAELAQWWSRLGDPVLDQLIQQALAGSLDLKDAVSRVRQARAQLRITAGGLWPSASADGSGSLNQYRDDALNWLDRESYSAKLGVAWEADFFGGTKREVEAALADQEAAQEDLGAALVSLTADTATAYITLRTYQARLATARENLRLQEETLELTRIKFQTGMAGALDLEQASYSLESTRAKIPDLLAGMAAQKNALAVLLGVWPKELPAGLDQMAAIPKGQGWIAAGAPAELLRRRPDVRAAERRLAGQTARIGAAEAELYPKLKLSGSAGWEAVSLSGLISPASMVAALGAGISWPLFNLEAVRGNIEVRTALQEQALLSYESTLRTAVKEVENALTGVAQETAKQEALAQGVKAAQAAAELSLQGYENGISDFQTVLTSQQSLTSFEDSLASSRGQSALNLITLYKALGGGWSPGQIQTLTQMPPAEQKGQAKLH